MSTTDSTLNAFTVDLEDWFQGLTSTNPQIERWPELESRVVQATDRLLAVLDEHGVKATFFVLGYVAEHHPDLVARVAAAGHEIGLHGYYHRPVNKLTPDEFERELDRCLEVVVRITGDIPLGHRAPYFSINASSTWAFGIIAERGLRYDSSVFPTRNMLYGYPEAPRFPYRLNGLDLVEFPLTTARFAGLNWPVAGGFYNRVWPYGLLKKAIRQLNRQGRPSILYIHPWELDTSQVYDRVTFRERLTHYYGRAGLEKKLHTLFEDFHFGPLQSLFEGDCLEDGSPVKDASPIARPAS